MSDNDLRMLVKIAKITFLNGRSRHDSLPLNEHLLNSTRFTFTHSPVSIHVREKIMSGELFS